MRISLSLAAVPLILAGLLAPAGVQARPAYFHWEKIHIVHSTPTQVFQRLGLTHITRRGYTRGSSKSDPDPHFPPGLTDVVPDDASKTLLVRGTDNGLVQFRPRVVAADVAAQPWHLNITLLQSVNGQDQIVGAQDKDDVTTGVPVEVTFGAGEDRHPYQLCVQSGLGGALSVLCRTGLVLPAAVANDGPPDPHAANPSPIFVPGTVWTTPVTRPVGAGGLVVFDDRAVDRRAARVSLSPAAASAPDFRVQVTVTPAAPPAAAGDGAPSAPPGRP